MCNAEEREQKINIRIGSVEARRSTRKDRLLEYYIEKIIGGLRK